MNTIPDARPVVVGVDGSPTAAAALEWAVAEAERRGVDVRAITAWPGAADPAIAGRVADQVAAAARPGVRVRSVGEAGSAGRVLVEHAANGSLLVVGSHGTARVLSVLLGSVSAYCLRHAPCPVVVVPTARVAAEAPDPGVFATPGPLL